MCFQFKSLWKQVLLKFSLKMNLLVEKYRCFWIQNILLKNLFLTQKELKPQTISISFSNDTISFSKTKQTEVSSKNKSSESSLGLLTIPIHQKSRYLKINIKGVEKCPETYPCAGNSAWFFIDEIIINK